jgi:hypothetical protein
MVPLRSHGFPHYGVQIADENVPILDENRVYRDFEKQKKNVAVSLYPHKHVTGGTAKERMQNLIVMII